MHPRRREGRDDGIWRHVDVKIRREQCGSVGRRKKNGTSLGFGNDAMPVVCDAALYKLISNY